MDLPAPLRQAIADLLDPVPLADLKAAGFALSARYRAETRDGRLHLSDDLLAMAYLATRLPATYAAVRASLSALAEARPDVSPASLLDIGAGPGTVLHAAQDLWPGLGEARLVEASAPIRALGERLLACLPTVSARYEARDLRYGTPGRADLVTATYLLDELSPGEQGALVDSLWQACGEALLLVEPGTPAGWRRILAARDRLLRAGASILAPCPHALACPLAAPDWCHFAERLPRSRLHRLAKEADVPFEDEKFVYLAAARRPGEPPAARVLAPPRAGSGKVQLKLCRSDGRCGERLVTRREGEAFRAARRAEWGDGFA
ncbi:small ribosomal subunit Rsm22 family protein [Aurantimonas sp. Leaf443]|uniref:small ribosomal subunit Rsm22 family protein n=1 Tax=Aurantimonas sp. Leaf443 TaxID=1736378 RepID=UPI0006F2247D|nr:small ribosomal subunit Rsm22 family protein [Aurantimonas sp. Leaf443]KQT85817.1 methyltransferase type 11 [Aurantimonas sp. Leaf443]